MLRLNIKEALKMKNKLHRIMPRAALVFCMICAFACFSLKNNDVAKAKATATPTVSLNAVQDAWERGYENGTKAAKEETKSKKETKNTEDEETSFCLVILASIVGSLLGYVLVKR